MAGRIRIGISGWTYAPWRGVFYPKRLPQKRELAYAAEHFPSIEINGSFYSLQRPASYEAWRDATPRDFVFALKGSRYITHMRRLRDAEQGLANFLASGPLALGEKLGPMLWQLPPNFIFKPEVIEPFLQLLPRDTLQAAELARGHEARLRGRAFLQPEKKQRLRHAMEVRHESFVCEEFIRLLRKYNVALVCADTVEWPLLMDVTADFLYLRLHGSEELYKSGYGPKALDTWADRIHRWAAGGDVKGRHASAKEAAKRKSGRDVFVYFDNDAKVRAPKDAQGLMRRLGIAWDRQTQSRVIAE
ncbi:DUF72 domain-containing protein [Silvibacterium sp.]|uniref:DUF72 domain-containing protein n=1 Tax=Silvibacterium sp. TaxID=1964179 RepID=UPI0039E33E33